MPIVNFISPDGEKHAVEVEGGSAMRAALQGGVEGITADCGGEASCATCHVYVDEGWVDKVGEPSLDEEDMLEFTDSERKSCSRLSCQIDVNESHDGLTLMLPESQ